MKQVKLDYSISSYLYEQVSHYLEIMIEKGTLSPGSQIPSEQELCNLFNTSRITVRRAIKELSDKGILDVVHGKGTFVSARSKKEMHLLEFGGYTDGLGDSNGEFSKKILSKGIRSADNADKLLFKRTQPFEVFTLVRLVFDKEGPFSLDFSYFPDDVFPGIMEKIDSTTSTFKLAREDYHIQFKYVNKTIEFLTRDVEVAKLMAVPISTPLIQVRKFICNNLGEIVHFSRYYLLPDKVKLSFDVILNNNTKSEVNIF